MNQKFLTGQAVILAAGESSRFWPLNQRHKSLINILGRPIILHAISALSSSGIKDVIVVQGPDKDTQKILSKFKIPAKIIFVVHPKPTGTGEALLRASKYIKDNFVLLGAHKADVGNYLPNLLKKFKKEEIVFLVSDTDRPWDFGVLDIKNGRIRGIVENPKKGREPSKKKTNEVYVIPKSFLGYLKKAPFAEDSLISGFNLFLKDKGATMLTFKEETISLKYPWDALAALKVVLERQPTKSQISPKAKLGKNVVIGGSVSIGENTVIGNNSVIIGPCYIGKNCRIGQVNVLRGPVNLEDNVTTGAFAEIKNTIIQEGTHIHSGYFGDMVIGRNCRFGAGFVSGNRRLDRGEIFSRVKGKKTGTRLTFFGGAIGDNSCFGIHVSMMPGVLVGNNCTIGPHSVVFGNIEDNATFYNKFAGVVKKS